MNQYTSSKYFGPRTRKTRISRLWFCM